MDVLEQLNNKQKEAVLHTNGPILVYAGAGSGKTRALTHRIAYLIHEKGINPWNILAVTFTNKAANEMKERIIKLIGSEDKNAIPTIGTFHAVCVRILRKNIHLLNIENSFSIYDVADQQILMKRVMKDLGINEKQVTPRAILSHISNAKNQLITPKKYHQFVTNYFTEKVAEAYTHYQKALHKNSALDFDDIIMKTVELLQNEPKILDYYQEKFKYISIDEYQDTNHAQYILTNLLAKKYKNLCVIGDSDQSIYSFRGANIQNILDFETDYPDAKIVLLEQNYRSSQNILDAAHSIIEKNTKRRDKKLWTEQEGGEKIVEKALGNERTEAQFVATEIQERLKGYEFQQYNDFVVLYRTNAQSRVLEEAFLRYGIPYKIVGGIKFYERKEVKDMVAYLRVIQNPSDSVSLFRIINTPTRKIGAKTIEIIQSYAFKNNISFFQAMEDVESINELNPSKTEAIQKFIKIIKDLQKVNSQFSASGVIKHVLDSSGYKKFIDDGTVEGESRLENIYELISVASKYDNLEAGISLNIFLEEISLIADVDSLDTNNNAVTLMTIHSAKGLEFPVVFIAGLEEGILPHSRSLLERDEIEEERRLMYVAMTRARERLYLLRTKSRMLYGEMQTNAPSQFLEHIPDEILESDEREARSIRRKTEDELGYTPVPFEEYDEEMRAHGASAQQGEELGPVGPNSGDAASLEINTGDTVIHASFGKGTVVSTTGGIATVAFDNSKHGIKKLALSIAPLTKGE